MPSAFISYSTKDREAVLKFAKDLEQHGVDLSYDEKDIKVGDSIVDVIDKKIRSSDFFLLVISNHSVRRPWVKREYSAALSLQLSKRRKPKILPIKIDGGGIPSLLSDIKYADLHRNYNHGLQSVLCSMALPATPAPLSGLLSTLSQKDINELTRSVAGKNIVAERICKLVYHHIRDDAELIRAELLALNPAFVSVMTDENTHTDSTGYTAIQLVESLSMSIHCEYDNTLDDVFLHYNFDGISHYITSLVKNRKRILSRELYVVPEMISWDPGSSFPDDHRNSGQINFKDLISSIGISAG